MTDQEFMYGKDPTQNIVNISYKNDAFVIFTETRGVVESFEIPYENWIVSGVASKAREFEVLKGMQEHRFLVRFEDHESYKKARQVTYKHNMSVVSGYTPQQSLMLMQGYSYFKGLKVRDVSVLSFDIETSGFESTKPDSKVFMISNTFRSQGRIVKKLFTLDKFRDETEMLRAWCRWVREIDPSIIIGHNIYIFDIPFLNNRYKILTGRNLELGRDGSEIEFAKKASRFRKDGSQAYDYFKCTIFGREICDTFFLSIRFDIAREFPSYGLKPIIEYLGWVAEDRQFYDASKIKDNWNNPAERAKIIKYGADDADDALKLYDHMIAPTFYLTQSIPMSFTQMLTSATGSQLNFFMIRSYLAIGYSIPSASAKEQYQGATSFGLPGLYPSVISYDVTSLYPSIMREYEVHDEIKDPFKHFARMVEIFTLERLANKKRFKETKDEYYDGLQAAQKIVINSAYGMLGASGLHFNSPANAAFITMVGRDVLDATMMYLTGYPVQYWIDKLNPDDVLLEELNELGELEE